MTTVETILLVLLAAILAVLVYVFFIKKEEKEEGNGGLLMLQQQLEQLRKTMDERMGESNRAIQESVKTQLGESTKIVREVTEGLTKLGETNRQVCLRTQSSEEFSVSIIWRQFYKTCSPQAVSRCSMVLIMEKLSMRRCL